MLWLQPAFFGLIGGFFAFFAKKWLAFDRRWEGRDAVARARTVRQIRLFGASMLFTAAVFVGLIVSGVFG